MEQEPKGTKTPIADSLVGGAHWFVGSLADAQMAYNKFLLSLRSSTTQQASSLRETSESSCKLVCDSVSELRKQTIGQVEDLLIA